MQKGLSLCKRNSLKAHGHEMVCLLYATQPDKAAAAGRGEGIHLGREAGCRL